MRLWIILGIFALCCTAFVSYVLADSFIRGGDIESAMLGGFVIIGCVWIPPILVRIRGPNEEIRLSDFR